MSYLAQPWDPEGWHLTIKPSSEGFTDASKRLLRQTEWGQAEVVAEALW